MEILKNEAELICHVSETDPFLHLSPLFPPPVLFPLFFHQQNVLLLCLFFLNHGKPVIARKCLTTVNGQFWSQYSLLFLVWQNLSKTSNIKKMFCDAVYPGYAPHSYTLVIDTNRCITTDPWGRVVLIILHHRHETYEKTWPQRYLSIYPSHLKQGDNVSTYLCRSGHEAYFVRSCWTVWSSSNWKWCFLEPGLASLFELSESRKLAYLYWKELHIKDKRQIPRSLGWQACICTVAAQLPPTPDLEWHILSLPADSSLYSFLGYMLGSSLFQVS